MSFQFSLRKARMQDHADISHLLRLSYEKSFSAYFSPRLLQDMLPLVTQADSDLLELGQYFVAQEVRGRIIGCGCWGFTLPDCSQAQSKRVHLRHFATFPDCVKRGVGGQILKICLEDAVLSGGQYVACFSSLNAVPFYKKHGFLPKRRVNVHITDIITFPTLLMEMELR